MNISVTLLRLGLGLLVAVPSMVLAAEAVETRPVSFATKPRETTAKEYIESIASKDPTQEWIEENGEKFGLFIIPKKKPAPPYNPDSKSLVYRPTEGVNFHKTSMSYIDDGFGNHQTASQELKEFKPPVEALKTDDAAAQISAVMEDLKFRNVCSKFATKNGFGTWGKLITDELIRGKANRMLEGTDDLRQSCPAYDYLGAREKSYVWVKIFAAMAFMESSCDPTKSAPGPYGTAAGLLGLHAGSESKAAPGCSKDDSQSPTRSLKCGVSIVETQIARTGMLFSPDTHFGVLRPQGDVVTTKNGNKRRVVLSRLIVGALKELPFCQRRQ